MTNYAITSVVRARCRGPVLGSTKTQTLVRDSRRISCNPTRTQIVDAPALAHDPVYGPKAHNGFNIVRPHKTGNESGHRQAVLWVPLLQRQELLTK